MIGELSFCEPVRNILLSVLAATIIELTKRPLWMVFFFFSLFDED